MALGRRQAAAALVLALGLDLGAGEPPGRIHPVVWIGQGISRLARRAPQEPRAAFIYGAAMAFAVPAAVAGVAAVTERASAPLPAPLDTAWLALALKPAFALRALLAAGARVEAALTSGDLDGARLALHSLVSRPTGDLDEGLVAAAAIESLAENLGDGFAGPLLAYAAAGLPGGWAYRALNTLDSMVGYRDTRFEWLGKASARLDDMVNLAPARLSALAITVAAPAVRGSSCETARIARRDHRLTASPNAGWPMAAAAGALGLRLEKRGHYILNPEGRSPNAADVRRARRLIAVAATLTAGAALAGVVARASIPTRPKR